MGRHARSAICIAWIATGAVARASAQQSPLPEGVAPVVSAVRIAGPIRVDGVLDEPEWQQAAPATDFTQQQPDEGRPATHRSEVRFLYDAGTLYVGAMLYDEAPTRAIVNELQRDFQEPNNDLFGVVLDTFQDGRNAYGFVTNPGGAQRETLAYDQGERNDASWNAIWTVRTAMSTDGWSVEMAIPFKALRFFDTAEQRWGLNLIRVVRRNNEVATWSPVPRQFTQYHVGYAGTLAGIVGVRSGRNLRVTPFTTTQANRPAVSAPWHSDVDGGADLKWAITPSLVLDGTYRTDFAQVEADQVQINLTRFNLRFPEKRQFFLESPGSFQIGLSGDQGGLVPFFTRRIGLADDGTPIDVVGGARLTGQSGGATIGLLNMQTERYGDRPGDNFTAARVLRPLGRGVTAGGFYFGREATGTAGPLAAFNRVTGGDVRFSPSRTFELDALAMRSASDGPEDDWTVQSSMRLRANQHRGRLTFLQIGDRFRHDLGFVQRRGVGMAFGDYSAIFRPRATYKWIREYELRMEARGVTDAGYERLLTRELRPSLLMQFADGGQFRTSLENNFERLTEPFPLRRNLIIPPGDYHFGELVLFYESTRSKRLSVLLHGNYGAFWDGDRRRGRVGVRWRLNAHLAASAEYDRNIITLPGGSFSEPLLALRVDWSLTTRMFLNALVQYNGRDEVWLSNVRFNLIHRPLSDIYIVWNDARGSAVRNAAAIVKYTHSFAF
jgi:hypothetical protein